MADSERATPISYKWSVVTFGVSCIVFELFWCFIYNGISPSRANFWGFFAPHNPKFENSSTRPLKGTCCRENTHFELSYVGIRQSVRPVRVAKEADKKKKDKTFWASTSPLSMGTFPLSDPYQIWHTYSSLGRNHVYKISCWSVHPFWHSKGLNFPFSPLEALSPIQ